MSILNRRLPILVTLALLAVPLFAADDVAKLHALFDRAWETRLRERPTFATSVGRHEYNHPLSSVTPADPERRHAHARAVLSRRAPPHGSQPPPPRPTAHTLTH